MNIRRLLVITCAGIAMVVIVVLAGSAYWENKQKPFDNAPKLIDALRAFSGDQLAGGRRLPPEISLQDLLRGGYLTTNDVGAYAGMDVTFNTQADDTNPQGILARARMPDGQFICLVADGSVQQLSASRYREALQVSGQKGSTNVTQPFRSETNGTSGAGDFRR